MKIYNANFKIYRLDVNTEVLKNSVGFVGNEIVPEIYPASDGLKDACRFGLRISSSFRQKDTGVEMIGYLFEYYSDFEIGDIDTDRIDLKIFVQNALLNHETAFQENKPIGVQFSNFIINPNYDYIVERIISSLQIEGYYP